MIKVIPLAYYTASGLKKSYGIIINGKPILEGSKEEIEAFIKGYTKGLEEARDIVYEKVDLIKIKLGDRNGFS